MLTSEKNYEFSFIIPGNIPEDQHQQIFSHLKNLFEENQAKNLISTEAIGRRKFAYPVSRLRHGFYFTWEFALLPQNLAKIEKELKIYKEVLRYLIIQKPVKTSAILAKEKKIKETRLKAQLAKEKEAVKQEEGKKEKMEKGKVSLDDLDKKLDELLSEEIK